MHVTDYHMKIINIDINLNIKLNQAYFQTNTISSKILDILHYQQHINILNNKDILIVCDIIYLPEILTSLMSLFYTFLSLNKSNNPIIYSMQTIRIPTTFQIYKNLLDNHQYLTYQDININTLLQQPTRFGTGYDLQNIRLQVTNAKLYKIQLIHTDTTTSEL